MADPPQDPPLFPSLSNTPSDSAFHPTASGSVNLPLSASGSSIFGSAMTSSDGGSKKSNIFGGSAFVKPSDNTPGTTVWPSIFGGGGGASNAAQSPQGDSTLKPSIFGGTTPKSETSMSLDTNVKPSIFGGITAGTPTVKPGSSIFGNIGQGQNTSDSLVANSKTNIFGNAFKKNESMGSATNNFGSSNIFASVTTKPEESLSSIKPSIFGPPAGLDGTHTPIIPVGGALKHSTGLFSNSSSPLSGQASEGQGSVTSVFSRITPKSSEGVTSSSEKFLKPQGTSQHFNAKFGDGVNNKGGSLFKVPSTTFGMQPATNREKNVFTQAVSSSLTGDSKNRTVSSTVRKSTIESRSSSIVKQDGLEEEDDGKLSRAEQLAEERDKNWEPDSMEDYDQEEDDENSRIAVKQVKKNLPKRGVFGKALYDVVAKASGADDMKTIYCFPIDGINADSHLLKKHFSQYGAIQRLSIHTTRHYCLVTFKTHEHARIAKREGVNLNGRKIHIEWREKSKRKVEQTSEKSEEKESTKQSGSYKMNLDPDVRDELDAMVGDNYEIQDSTKSKLLKLDTGAKRKRQPERLSGVSKARNMDIDPEVQEELAALSELGDRTFRTSSRLQRDPVDQTPKEPKSRKRKVVREKELSEKKPPVRTTGVEKSPTKKFSVLPVVEKEENMDRISEEALNTSDAAIASTVGASELLAIMREVALTPEDKLKVLEARDKLIRLRQVKQYDISKVVKTVGTCPDMCPEKERLLRETRRQISQYEMSSKTSQMDPLLMVKQYSRSSADQEEPLPHELRPPAVLTMTMSYLLHTIMDLCDQLGENLAEWYHFLWDRTRGIRKEITQQELCDADSVRLVEQCARFHIHCCARLVAEDMSVFDDRINTENLTKCLQTLKHMYHDLWINSSITCPNEAEFITYFILLNLNNGTIMWEMEQLREETLTSPEVAFAASLYSSLSSNNYVRFFRLVQNASYLNSCLCIRYFYQVRSRALRTYVKALAKVRSVPYHLAALVKDLGFENIEEATDFCSHYGLVVHDSSEGAVVVLSQENLSTPETVLPRRRVIRLAESKKVGSVGEVVYGGPLPPRSFDNHIPHNSFDNNGLLLRSAFSAKDQGAIGSGREEDLELELADEQVVLEQKPICTMAQDTKKTVEPIAAASAPHKPTEITNNSTSATQLKSQPFLVSGSMPKPSPALFSTISTAPTNFPPVSSTPSKPFQVSRSSFVSPVSKATGLARQTTWIAPGYNPRPQIQVDPQKQAEEEFENAVKKEANSHTEEIVEIIIREVIQETAMSELETAKADFEAAQEQELRRRVLESHVERTSNDMTSGILEEVVLNFVHELSVQVLEEEQELVRGVENSSHELLHAIFNDVVEEECILACSEELKYAQELARQEALERFVKQCFYKWLHAARRSLRMRYAMQDFPAGVMPLSITEHAERWGYPKDSQLGVWGGQYGQHEKPLDFPEFKTVSAYPQTTLADLIGVLAAHRYDSVRSQYGLHPTDQLLYKLFVSVPSNPSDRGARLPEWWIRKTFKKNDRMVYDHDEEGVLRHVSGLKVAGELAIYASLQLVKGIKPIAREPSLMSGTSALLFMVSPDSDVEESRSRLHYLISAVPLLPRIPLVVAVLSPSEPPIEGLKQLVAALKLDFWLQQNAISDYQILHVEDRVDLDYFNERLKPALNYMVMTWIPNPHFDLVCMRNILTSTFQMFYISIQFNYNSSEVYPQDIEDPRVLIGLCNEWLDHMGNEFVTALNEAKDLCAGEFWPLLNRGAYVPFHRNPNYEQNLKEILTAMHLPEVRDWPPQSEVQFSNWCEGYMKWLTPEDYKQSKKRLSCLDGIPWPEKLKAVPWIPIIENWMEAKMRHTDTRKLCGSEIMCLVRAKNVEQLYTNPWWAHSRHIIEYLESHRTGREDEMDLDQTVPSESLVDQTMESFCEDSPSCHEKRATSNGLNQLKEVASSIVELKNLNESLMARIQKTLNEDVFANDILSTKSSDIVTLRKGKEGDLSLDSQPVAESQTEHCAEHCAEHSVNTSFNRFHSDPLVSDSVRVDDKSVVPPNKMQDILASMHAIVSSLDKKHGILSAEESGVRRTGLLLGCEEVDKVETSSADEKFQSNSFVKESQLRMKERLEANISLQKDMEVADSPESDLEVLSDGEDSASTYIRSPSMSSITSHSRSAEENSSDYDGSSVGDKSPEYDDSEFDSKDVPNKKSSQKNQSMKKYGHLSPDSDEDTSVQGNNFKEDHEKAATSELSDNSDDEVHEIISSDESLHNMDASDSRNYDHADYVQEEAEEDSRNDEHYYREEVQQNYVEDDRYDRSDVAQQYRSEDAEYVVEDEQDRERLDLDTEVDEEQYYEDIEEVDDEVEEEEDCVNSDLDTDGDEEGDEALVSDIEEQPRDRVELCNASQPDPDEQTGESETLNYQEGVDEEERRNEHRNRYDSESHGEEEEDYYEEEEGDGEAGTEEECGGDDDESDCEVISD